MAAIGGDEAGPRKVVIVSMTGASHSEHDTDLPGAEVDSVRAGHEADKFGASSILAVPALLTLVVLIAFGVVSGTIYVIYTRFLPAPAGGLNPQGVAINTVESDGGRRDRDISTRFSRIGSTAPKDVDGLAGTAVPQPRLEYLKQTAPESKADPAFVRSKRSVEASTNTYEIRPEDLRPDNYHDPVTGDKVLATYGWADHANKKVARVPIDQAVKMVLADKKKLPARKDAIPSPASSVNTPTVSNGGLPAAPNATQEGQPTPPPAAKHDDHDHKKGEKH